MNGGLAPSLDFRLLNNGKQLGLKRRTGQNIQRSRLSENTNVADILGSRTLSLGSFTVPWNDPRGIFPHGGDAMDLVAFSVRHDLNCQYCNDRSDVKLK